MIGSFFEERRIMWNTSTSSSKITFRKEFLIILRGPHGEMCARKTLYKMSSNGLHSSHTFVKVIEDRSGSVSEVDFSLVVQRAMLCLHVSPHVVGGAC